MCHQDIGGYLKRGETLVEIVVYIYIINKQVHYLSIRQVNYRSLAGLACYNSKPVKIKIRGKFMTQKTICEPACPVLA